MRFTEAENAYHEPTIWVDDQPVLSRCNLTPGQRDAWPHIVRALTTTPVDLSEQVAIETLHAEVTELRRANDDLNRELADLRRAHA